MPRIGLLPGSQAPQAIPNSTPIRIHQRETRQETLLSPPAPRGSNYVLGPEDVINIDVFNVPELSKNVRVANDG